LVLLILTAVTTQRPDSLLKNGHPYLSKASDHAVPKTPGYEIIHPPFGQGAYGTVWLARNTKGQWRALKTIYLTKFNNESAPFDREFSGVSRYQPISDKHSGLLRVEFVSEKLSDYFYYVMELGDSLTPGWEQVPPMYRPRDLANERGRADRRRLPIRDCMKIGLQLSDSLHFLHRHGLTHRDIKPQNVIFVNGKPKFADLGLIAQIRVSSQERTNIGTPGYMPPPPEVPGTPQSDVYALGVMLYVLITGRDPAYFPEIATTLEKAEEWKEFCGVNDIIRAACQPDLSKRYSSSLEMHEALKRALADSTGDVVD
jgi:serine/threonine protein kinase